MSLRCVCVTFILIIKACVVNGQNTNEECGKQTPENSHPWLVGIEFAGRVLQEVSIQCTGALVSPRHVLTTAVCFDDLYFAKSWKSIRGDPSINITAGRCITRRSSYSQCRENFFNSIRVPVETLIIHPDYEPYITPSVFSSYDIAVLLLRNTISYTNFIQPICLPRSDFTRLAEEDRHFFLAGINRIKFETGVSGILAHADLIECQERNIREDEVCAGGILPCLLPGELMFNRRRNRDELVGFTTSGSNCRKIRIVSNLFLNLDWIQSDMTGLNSLLDVKDSNIDDSWVGCGKRKVNHTALIVHGEGTKIGDWPWHVAIYRLKKSSLEYICGGTLISKTMILTAAHCVTIRGETVNPEILSVVLGKYNLIGKDLESQEKEVHSVIVHENFAPNKHFEDDIALVKLKTEATYTDYVQPACVWSSEANARLPTNGEFGTVVGWGIAQLNQLASHLRKADMPKVSDITCIRKNPLFYTTVLENNKKFCAGWGNGTSPCNGDSGGGFLVFVPDTAKDDSANAVGSWFIRGIVSLTAIIRNVGQCDPSHYVVFTDVEKYSNWIKKHS